MGPDNRGDKLGICVQRSSPAPTGVVITGSQSGSLYRFAVEYPLRLDPEATDADAPRSERHGCAIS